MFKNTLKKFEKFKEEQGYTMDKGVATIDDYIATSVGNIVLMIPVIIGAFTVNTLWLKVLLCGIFMFQLKNGYNLMKKIKEIKDNI